MFRSTSLSSSHYAGKWAILDESQRNDLAAINLLGYAYGVAADGPEKEAQLHKLLECFHGYLSKYLVMIIRGTLPESNSRAGKDAREFLRMLRPGDAPKGADLSHVTCKMLHLAFKQQTTEEVYDTLAFCFMRAARRYDPLHTDKIREVCKEIGSLTNGKTEFKADELEARVGFPVAGILRALVRKGYLASIVGKKRKVIGYTPANWPPPASFLESGPIGFVYVLQMWFRYYLNEHITEQMGEIEAFEGMFQMLETSPVSFNGKATSKDTYRELLIPHPEGNCTNSNGTARYMADRTLMDAPMDVSRMSPAWVAGTSNKLFSGLTPFDRSILYMHFYEELTWKQIGKATQKTDDVARQHFDRIMAEVRALARISCSCKIRRQAAVTCLPGQVSESEGLVSKPVKAGTPRSFTQQPQESSS